MAPRVWRKVWGPVLVLSIFLATSITNSYAQSAGPNTIYLPVVLHSPGGPTLACCPMFPANNIWNARVDQLPVHSRSAAYIRNMRDPDYPNEPIGLHADFGSGEWDGGPIGIPYVVVPGSQPKVPITFEYEDESDLGLYPIPANAPIEGGPDSDGDRHILIVDKDNCVLYEVYAAYPLSNGTWKAGSGARYDLRSNALREAGWTSADAAGLPILPGLVRYDEITSGQIRHALRFTSDFTQSAYVWPARHEASAITDPNYPPMGQRFRLKKSFDISGYEPQIQVLLRAMQEYGLILADNGSSWYISGVPDERWDNELLHTIDDIDDTWFEAVDTSSLMVNPNSGQVR